MLRHGGEKTGGLSIETDAITDPEDQSPMRSPKIHTTVAIQSEVIVCTNAVVLKAKHSVLWI